MARVTKTPCPMVTVYAHRPAPLTLSEKKLLTFFAKGRAAPNYYVIGNNNYNL